MSTPDAQRILLVIDDAHDRARVRQLLEPSHPVEAVAHGQAALEAATSSDPPALVLTARLGPPLDGLELLRQVRARTDLPVILLCLEDDEDWRARALDAGADDYLRAPFSQAELLARIELQLQRARQRREAAIRQRELAALAEERQEALRASEARLRTFLSQSRDGVIIVDKQGAILEWNEGEEQITGIPRDEALGHLVWEVQHRLAPSELRTAERLGVLRDIVLGALAEGTNLERTIEEEIERPDGARRTIESKLFAVRSDGNVLTGGITRDITERKHLEEELRERKTLLLEAERLVNLGHFDRDLRTGKAFWSDEVYRILGHPPGAIPPERERLLAAIVPEDRARISEALIATARDGVTRSDEFRIVTPDGEVRTLLATVGLLRDEAGAPARILGAVQDVTRRRLAAQALARSREDLRHAQAVAHVGSGRIEVRSGRIELSEEAYRILGLPPSAPVTVGSILAVVHPDDRAQFNDAWQAMLRGDPFDAEHRIVVEGEVRWVREVAYLERAPDGTPVTAFGTIQDVTDRKLMERALEDANRRKDEFLAILSHELRNPLAAVRSGLHVLGRAEAGGEQARRMQEIIERQVSHLARLVDDLLDVTRIARGKVQLKKERVELGEVIRRTMEEQRPTFEASGVDLRGEASMPVMWLVADPTRVAQVVNNLLSNAVKFTPRGGRVEVRLEQDGEDAVLRVRDTGVGITQEMSASIFEPFTQADRTLDRARGGLGLGLALTRGLVELHGGSISVVSDGPGKGAEFTVRLPLADGTRQAVAAAQVGQPVRPRRVLIIDDTVDLVSALKEALELDGHEVAVAYDGPEGLARARAFKPEVVLCDIGLPGMDGYQVARAFRAEEGLRGTFLVALTGYALPEDMQRALQAGFDRHLAKPPSFEQLEELLAEVPDGGGTRARPD
jgi:PAS domain S-box-containing protein